MVGGTMHPVQMMVYPIDEDFYIILLDELDISLNREEDMTIKKVDTIQNIYLFSMYIDLAERLRKKVEAETFEKVGKITCSIGITEIRAGDGFDSAFERMDHALYQAKAEGRNCVRVG